MGYANFDRVFGYEETVKVFVTVKIADNCLAGSKDLLEFLDRNKVAAVFDFVVFWVIFFKVGNQVTVEGFVVKQFSAVFVDLS